MLRRRAVRPVRRIALLGLGLALTVPFTAGVARADAVGTFIDSPVADPGNDPTPTIAFHADVAGSTFQCQVDGFDPVDCSSPYTTDPLDDGFHVFSVWATDPEGDTSDPVSVFFSVDTVPPTTTLWAGPADPTKNDMPSFWFYSLDFPVTFRCSMDGGAPVVCSSPFTQPVALPDGPHTFSVAAVDAAGNVDPTPPTWSFTVDTIPPVVSIDAHPAALSNDPSPSFGFSSNEAGSTFSCSVDGGASSTCASPVSLGGMADGSHTFSVYATDRAGNTGVAQSFTWTIDTVPPDTSIDSGPVSPTLDPTSTFTFSASEAGSTFECSMDGAAWASCSSPFITDPLGGGAHTFAVRATDPAGNTDPTPASQTFTVQTGPTSVFTQTPDARVSGTVHFRARTQPLQRASFECYLAPGQDAWAPCPAGRSGLLVMNYSGLAPGTYTFHARATDLQGNTGPAIEFTFTVL